MQTDNLASKISESELEVMKVLWEAGDALPVSDIREILQVRKNWEATTVKTLITRLVKKGALQQIKKNVSFFAPRISEDEYNDWATGNLITRLYKGKASSLVAALVRSDELKAEDIEELRKMFKIEG